MVAAISTPINPKTANQGAPPHNPTRTRPPLLPSESDNALAPRRPKAREVTSRYMSSSSSSSISRRCNSPLVSRTVSSTATVSPMPPPPSLAKRPHSVERRRPVTPAAEKMLFTSTRSLSVSFQGESFSFHVSKAKPATSPGFRRGTPERKKASTPANSDQIENSRPLDQHRWPGRMRHTSVDSLVPSDNESVSSSSGSSSGAQECGLAQRVPRGIVVPGRFWQEANNRLRRHVDPGSPSSRNSGNNAIAPPKVVAPRKSVLDSPVSSPRGVINSRGHVSPIRAAIRPASPSKLATPYTASPSRGLSPSRVRNGVAGSLNNCLSNEPSILSFAVDVRRGRIGENRVVDAHFVRLLYNRLLQWRFANARADTDLSVQGLNAEKSLYGAWTATYKLRESVRAKRTELQLLKQHFKLISILKEQMIYLEDWAILDPLYSGSLSGAIEALKASTLRLPVVGGAKADVLNVKDAVCSAVDVMRAMASSMCLLLPKVGHVNSLVVEVASLSAKEHVLLDECKDLLSMITAMQVRECSLRTHLSQLKCLPRSPTMKVTST